METYNGWKNYETWNVSLWINNDRFLHEVARTCKTYKDFVQAMRDFNIDTTRDEISYQDYKLDVESLDEVISEINS